MRLPFGKIRRLLSWIVTYLRESRREMQKVNWPTRKDVARMTGLVILFSAVVALILGGFDFLFTRALLRVLPEVNSPAAPIQSPVDVSVENEEVPFEVTTEPPPPSEQ